jgi:lysozyme
MNVERLKEQLVAHEGLKQMLYRCTSGYLTIGVGRNLDAKGIHEDEAMLMLGNDIRDATDGARRLFSAFDALGDVRQRVLADMCLSLGAPRLEEFRRMRTEGDSGDFELAAQEMLD